jgi:hypothetical protein
MNSSFGEFWRSRFWRRWVAANAIAELVGLGTVAFVGFLTLRQAAEPTGLAQALVVAGMFIVLGGFEGAVVGLAQRTVLLAQLPMLRGWVRGTVAGAMVAWALGMVPSTVASLAQSADAAPPVEPRLAVVLLLAAALGAVTGPILAMFQWLSLRKAVSARAGYWLPANAIAWALGMPVIFLGAQISEFTSSPALIAGAVALALLAAGAIVGAIHGSVLLWLIPDRPARAAPRQRAAADHQHGATA